MSHYPPVSPHEPPPKTGARSGAARADVERVHAAAAEWRKRSQLIHFFRRALPAAIIVVGASLLLWVVGKSIWSSLTGLKASEGAQIRVTNARFYGQERGRSFVLGAKEAMRANAATQLVTLTGPTLKLNNPENKPTDARAAKGVYDQRSQRVALTGGVSVADSGSGYRFSTERTIIDTRTGVITGDSPVKGSGPLGQITASSYAITDNGTRMTFRGNVRARINARTTQ